MALRILVVDDHDVVRQGVRLILRDRPDWQICGEAENGAQALQKERQLRPDLIILDVTMPDIGGLQVASELHSRNSPAKIIILTMHEAKELERAAKAAGVQGYVIKTHAARDLVTAIQTMIDGGHFFSFGDTPSKAREGRQKDASEFHLTPTHPRQSKDHMRIPLGGVLARAGGTDPSRCGEGARALPSRSCGPQHVSGLRHS
jgi:Response regulator containing a CheY-like receiver domain and an HTH DNA-binding domain